MAVKQCAALVINTAGAATPHRAALEKIGFRVVETGEWPADEMVLAFEVVIVLLSRVESISMVGARLRAKPHFGHRILIAVVPCDGTSEDRRRAVDCGFDDLVTNAQESRVLIARILRRLRARPEHRCFLPELKRRAA